MFDIPKTLLLASRSEQNVEVECDGDECVDDDGDDNEDDIVTESLFLLSQLIMHFGPLPSFLNGLHNIVTSDDEDVDFFFILQSCWLLYTTVSQWLTILVSLSRLVFPSSSDGLHCSLDINVGVTSSGGSGCDDDIGDDPSCSCCCRSCSCFGVCFGIDNDDVGWSLEYLLLLDTGEDNSVGVTLDEACSGRMSVTVGADTDDMPPSIQSPTVLLLYTLFVLDFTCNWIFFFVGGEREKREKKKHFNNPVFVTITKKQKQNFKSKSQNIKLKPEIKKT